MGGEYTICFRHNFEGIARYGECPHCKDEAYAEEEKHPVKHIPFIRKIRQLVKLVIDLENLQRKPRKGIGGLIRQMYLSEPKLEYDPDKKEIKSVKTGEVWFVATNPNSRKPSHTNVMGYELTDRYNNILGIREIKITYVQIKPIPLKRDERIELNSKIKALENRLLSCDARYIETRGKLRQELMGIRAEILEGAEKDPQTLIERFIDYLEKEF